MPAYGAAPYLPAIVLERPVYLREMSDGLYSPFSYLLYKVLFPDLVETRAASWLRDAAPQPVQAQAQVGQGALALLAWTKVRVGMSRIKAV